MLLVGISESDLGGLVSLGFFFTLLGGLPCGSLKVFLLQVKASGEGLWVDCRFPEGCVPPVSFLLKESFSVVGVVCSLVMVALCNRADHYIFILFLSSSSFFSSTNLSGQRLDVYHTLAHGVALVRMQVWNALHAARCKYRTQKIAISAPSHNFVGPYLRN